MLCPPLMISSTPCASIICAMPLPAATLTRPVPSFLGAGCCTAAALNTRCSCCSAMLSILISCSVPHSSACCKTTPGLAVWICTFTTSSIAATISELPNGANAARTVLSSTAVFFTINSVQYGFVKSTSSADRAAILLTDMCCSSSSGKFLPRRPFKQPCKNTIRPWPPASTTPAAFKAGKSSGVRASSFLPPAMASVKISVKSSPRRTAW